MRTGNDGIGWLGLAGAVALALSLCIATTFALAAEPAAHRQDEQAIRETAQRYMEGIKRGDAGIWKEFWTDDGEIVDEHGRATSVRELAAQPANASKEASDVKLTASSIRFVTPDVAIEDGTSEVTHPGGAKSVQGRFTAVWVKQEGAWRLSSLRERPMHAAPMVTRLADLDWMVGTWSGQTPDATIEVAVQWNATHTYLLREMKLVREGQVVFRGAQRIGWDPIAHRIRSWIFDADGGYGEGLWTKEHDGWVVHAVGVLPDGKQTQSTNIVRDIDKDSFVWKSTSGRNDGKPVPDLEIKFVRKAGAGQ